MERNLQIFITAKTIKGTSFIGIRNYTNSSSEVSNQTILAGASYERAKAADILTVQDFDINSYSSEFSEDLRREAHAKILNSLVNPSTGNREGQIEAYRTIAPGLKLHLVSNEIHVFGFVIAKKLIVPGVYKSVNSKELTKCQDEIKKILDLKTAKYRQFKIGKAEELQIQGFTI